MAISASVYSNANSVSATVSVDFVGEILVPYSGSFSSSTDYYFKFSTGSRDTASGILPVKAVQKLSDLALNGNVQSQTPISSAYLTIDSMVSDYIYDYIHGHDANQFLSGCSQQLPLKFK